MKKGQTIVEYVITFFLAAIICYGLVHILWNRNVVVHDATGGAEDEQQVIHVRAIGENQ